MAETPAVVAAWAIIATHAQQARRLGADALADALALVAQARAEREEATEAAREKLRQWTARFEFHEDEAAKTITMLCQERDRLLLQVERHKFKAEQDKTQRDDRWAGVLALTNKAIEEHAMLNARIADARREVIEACARRAQETQCRVSGLPECILPQLISEDIRALIAPAEPPG